VVDRFPELLAQRRGARSKGKGPALARFPGPLHLWFGRGHSGDWAAREVDVLADQEKRAQTLSRVHGCEWPRTRTRPS
jgi:hypothetical protein